jgi:hypothetical protein
MHRTLHGKKTSNPVAMYMFPWKLAEAITVMTYIRKVPGSNFSRDINYTN